MKSPFPSRWHTEARDGLTEWLSPEALVAWDACEASDPRAMSLLVGLPATMQIGSDLYAARVVSTTARTITIVYGWEVVCEGPNATKRNGELLTFRSTRHGWTYRKHHRLTVGEARHRMDPGF